MQAKLKMHVWLHIDLHMQDETDEFEHLQDEEEFEGFDKDRPQKSKSHDKPPPDLKITNVRILILLVLFVSVVAAFSIVFAENACVA